MPIATIDPVFQTQLVTLTSQEATNSDAAQLDGTQPVWWSPSTAVVAPNWNGNPLTITGTNSMARAFNRKESNDNYLKAIETSGTPQGGRVVDRIVTKIQVDYLAAMERAFRALHSTCTRCEMHAASRHLGAGSTNGVFTRVRDYLESTLSGGYIAPANPQDAGIS